MTSQQSGQSAPSAPDVLVTSNVQKYAMKKKKILNPEESELFELTQAAGITIDQEIFKIIVDLLKMNVAPQAVFQTLKSMCAGQRIADTSLGDSSTSSHTTSLTTAPAEHREDDSAVSGKSAKPPAPPPSSSGTATRPTRVNAKIAVYGPQDAHSQVRSKSGAGHSDKSLNREGSSSQKVQRQPSATRGQKTKSSGSSSSSSTQITST